MIRVRSDLPSSEIQASRRPSWLAPGTAAALLTFLIWASSPLLFAVTEPWDTPYPFYSLSTLLGGVLLGCRFRGALLACFLGAWLGQVVALLTLPGHDRTWLALGIVTTAIGSLLVLVGVALAGRIVRRAAHLLGGKAVRL